MKNLMESLLSDLAGRNENSNTIVLMADSFENLDADIDDLINKADRLLDEDAPVFLLKLEYQGDKLIEAKLNNKNEDL